MNERINAWKQLIIETMIQQVRADENLTARQKPDVIHKLKGSIGDAVAFNRIALALDINIFQLEKRLVRSVLRTKRPLKPKVVR